MNAANLIIIEDNRALSLAISALAERSGFQSITTPTLARAREQLRNHSYDLVLLDIGLPDGNGLEFLKENPFPNRPSIAVMTAHGDIENAISARKLGVTHFFDKPIDFESLASFFNEHAQQKKKVAPSFENTYSEGQSTTALIGASKNMRPVFQQIAKACATSDPLVIRGKTGTGKSHIARFIQNHSTSSVNYILNATQQTSGGECSHILTQAQNGSLIIENLLSLSIEAQNAIVATLNHLDTKAPRLIATVDENGLYPCVTDGTLITDLYYRLQVLEIDLPLLSDRPEDIPALASYFLGELAGPLQRDLDQTLLEAFQNHDWPGNLRELRNLISYLVVSKTETTVFRTEHLPPYFHDHPRQSILPKDDFVTSLENWIESQFQSSETTPVYKELHTDLERIVLNLLLQRYDNKPSHLAQAMGINRVTLRKKLQE